MARDEGVGQLVAGMMMKSSVSAAVVARWKKSKIRTTAVAEDYKALRKG
jgi:hypothetical protein